MRTTGDALLAAGSVGHRLDRDERMMDWRPVTRGRLRMSRRLVVASVAIVALALLADCVTAQQFSQDNEEDDRNPNKGMGYAPPPAPVLAETGATVTMQNAQGMGLGAATGNGLDSPAAANANLNFGFGIGGGAAAPGGMPQKTDPNNADAINQMAAILNVDPKTLMDKKSAPLPPKKSDDAADEADSERFRETGRMLRRRHRRHHGHHHHSRRHHGDEDMDVDSRRDAEEEEAEEGGDDEWDQFRFRARHNRHRLWRDGLHRHAAHSEDWTPHSAYEHFYSHPRFRGEYFPGSHHHHRHHHHHNHHHHGATHRFDGDEDEDVDADGREAKPTDEASKSRFKVVEEDEQDSSKTETPSQKLDYSDSINKARFSQVGAGYDTGTDGVHSGYGPPISASPEQQPTSATMPHVNNIVPPTANSYRNFQAQVQQGSPSLPTTNQFRFSQQQQQPQQQVQQQQQMQQQQQQRMATPQQQMQQRQPPAPPAANQFRFQQQQGGKFLPGGMGGAMAAAKSLVGGLLGGVGGGGKPADESANVNGFPLPFYAPSPMPPPAPNQVPSSTYMTQSPYPGNMVTPNANPMNLAQEGGVHGLPMNPAAFVAHPNNVSPPAPTAQAKFPFNIMLQVDESSLSTDVTHPRVYQMATHPDRHLMRSPVLPEHTEPFPELQL